MLLDAVEWTPGERPTDCNPELPWATHNGVLRLGGFELRVYQLSDGRRVIDADDMNTFFSAFDSHPAT